jgi:hypothetical protein
MKKINMQKIILVLIPVLFIFSGVSKADTFTYIDLGTYTMGGAGFNACNGCHITLTMQTDKPSYSENPRSVGGGDSVHVITTLVQGNSQMDPPNILTVVNPGHNNDIMTSTQSNDYGGWDFVVGKDQWGSNLFWNPGTYGITANNLGMDTSQGFWITNYNGNYQPGDTVNSAPPEIYFDVNQTSSSTAPIAPSIFVK